MNTVWFRSEPVGDTRSLGPASGRRIALLHYYATPFRLQDVHDQASRPVRRVPLNTAHPMQRTNNV
eukprot:396417-Prorocentrum_minimum.AAC.4